MGEGIVVLCFYREKVNVFCFILRVWDCLIDVENVSGKEEEDTKEDGEGNGQNEKHTTNVYMETYLKATFRTCTRRWQSFLQPNGVDIRTTTIITEEVI